MHIVYLPMLKHTMHAWITTLTKRYINTRNLSILTHVLETCVQINHFCNHINVTILHGTMVKNDLQSHIWWQNHLNQICDYDLQLILFWMKMKMKSAFISSMTNVVQHENLIIFAISKVVHKWLNNMWHFMQLELRDYIL
jgi:hypothetical protein